MKPEIQQIAGVLLIGIGAAVGIHIMIEPVYHVSTEASPHSPAWTYIDPFMALAIVLGAIFSGLRKLDADCHGESVSREYLAGNVQFYGFLFVGILFFWNWGNLLNPEFTPVGASAVSLTWALIDASLPLLSVSLGWRLMRGERVRTPWNG